MRRYADTSAPRVHHDLFLAQGIPHPGRIKTTRNSNVPTALVPRHRRQDTIASFFCFLHDQLTQVEHAFFDLFDTDLEQEIKCRAKPANAQKVHRSFLEPQSAVLQKKVNAIERELVLDAFPTHEGRGEPPGQTVSTVEYPDALGTERKSM
jgi:hypothetical protein